MLMAACFLIILPRADARRAGGNAGAGTRISSAREAVFLRWLERNSNPPAPRNLGFSCFRGEACIGGMLGLGRPM